MCFRGRPLLRLLLPPPPPPPPLLLLLLLLIALSTSCLSAPQRNATT
jgi:hypothetical protein